MTETTGLIDFTVGNETFKTWYRVVGNLDSGIRPVVALHGGPGTPYRLLDPFIDLVSSHGLPIIFYDQIGAGNSTHLPHKSAGFWTVELFMDELDNVLHHFNITDNFDLLGHSWGGMLASDYVATRHPTGIHRLVLGSTPASMPLWEVSTKHLLQRLPEDVRKTIERHERAGTTDHPEYQDGMSLFYHRFICTLDPWPEELQEAFAGMAANPTVYETMIGPSEFTITGTLKQWSVVDKLDQITCPTLLLNGADDEAQDVCVSPFFEKLPKVKWVQFTKCSHMTYFEEREKYMQVIGDFLTAK